MNAGRADEARAGFERRRARSTQRQGAFPARRRGDAARRFHPGRGLAHPGAGARSRPPPFLVKLGECYIEMKRWNDAERALRAALAERGDIERAHYDLALVLEARGDTPGAIAEYEAELARGASHSASFNLGRLLARGRPPGTLRSGFASRSAPTHRSRLRISSKSAPRCRRPRGGGGRARRGLELKPAADVAPLGHYVLADVYSRWDEAATPRVKSRARSGSNADDPSARTQGDRRVRLRGRIRRGVRGLFQPRRTATPSPRATCCSSRSTRSARIASAATAAATSTPTLDRLAAEGRSRSTRRSTRRSPGRRTSRSSPAAIPRSTGFATTSPPRSPRMCRRWRRSCRRGFQDGAFVSSIVLSAQSGLNRGFGTYSARFEAGADDARFEHDQRSGQDTVADAIAWMREQDLGDSPCGCISTSRTTMRAAGAYLSRCDGRPHDGESRGPTSSSDGCSARSNPLAPLGDPRDRHV